MSAAPTARHASASNPADFAAGSRARRRLWGSAWVWILVLALALVVIAAWKIYPFHPAELKSLTIEPSSGSIPQGSGMQYWAMGRYGDGSARDVTGDVKWVSLNPGVLSIDSSGLATAANVGTATVEATSESFNARFDVKITPPALVALAVQPSNLSIAQGSSLRFTVTGAISDGRREELPLKAEWTSSNPAVLKVDSSGLATALAPGSSIIRVASGSVATAAAVTVTTASSGFAGVFTSRDDATRTAQNRNETILTLANVNVSTFGKNFADAVDGFIYGQPLYVPSVTVPDRGVHNVVYVTTENNSVYAFDADAPGAPLWTLSLGPAVPKSAQPCNDLQSSIGVLGTPVIDPHTNTLYVVSRTYEDKTNYYRLHALDIATGAEKFDGPVGISAKVRGNAPGSRFGRITFDPSQQLQRPGLALADGNIYMAFGSDCDFGRFHGWVMAYDAATLKQSAVFVTTADGKHGGIWQAGAAPAVDLSGNLYVATGDGSFDADSKGSDYGDAVLKMPLGDAKLFPADYFAPSDQMTMFKENSDLGVGGPVLLPDQNGLHPHLLLVASKDGTIYLLDRDSLGRVKSGTDNQIVQKVANQFQTRIHGTPGFWQGPSEGWAYFCAAGSALKAFSLKGGVLSTSPTSETANTFGYPGASAAVSSNGTSNGIVWAISQGKNDAAILNAYDATNLAHRLYGSDEAPNGRDAAGQLVKFVVPTIANGKVYFGTQNALDVYGRIAN